MLLYDTGISRPESAIIAECVSVPVMAAVAVMLSIAGTLSSVCAVKFTDCVFPAAADLSLIHISIGYDKLNQLRHARFFKDFDGIKEHMKKHRALIEPKFRIVLDMLDKEIAPTGFGSWHKPNGGYFISFNAVSYTHLDVYKRQAINAITGAKYLSATTKLPFARFTAIRRIFPVWALANTSPLHI